MTREEVRDLSLRRKDEKGLTWEELGKAIGKSPIYTAMLLYGYGQATEEEAKTLASILELPEDAIKALMRAAYRTPSYKGCGT
ncbi:Cyanate hydratase [bacterium HR13]|nr:Cyanate hydratase [bacterium HR13]